MSIVSYSPHGVLVMVNREAVFVVVNGRYYIVGSNDVRKIIYRESEKCVDVVTDQYTTRYFTGIDQIQWAVEEVSDD